MKKLIICASLACAFASCKTVRIEGTPNVIVTNNESSPVPVSIQNNPAIQKVEVTNFPSHPDPIKAEKIPYSDSRRIGYGNGYNTPFIITPREGYDLIVEYVSVELMDHVSLKMTIDKFTRSFIYHPSHPVISERTFLLVTKNSPLTFKHTAAGTDQTAAVYVSGYLVPKQ